MSNFVRYAGVPGPRFSPGLWQNWEAKLRSNPSLGVLFADDFVNLPALTSANTGLYACYLDTGVTIKGAASGSFANKEIGVLEVAGNDAANDEGSITTGGNSGTLAKISDDAGEDKMVIFECRLKKASIANSATGFFVGLAEEGLAAADTLVDATLEVASKDLIGFQVLAADGASVNSIFRKAGQTKQTVKSGVATMVADTYIKLGFRYDPKAEAAKKISFWVNGVEQADYVTATQLAAATFPDGEELALLFATKNALGAESKLQMDWWACAQILA